MDTHAAQVLQTALTLPPGVRAEIAASLIKSLGEQAAADMDAAWAEEIKRRIESIDNGQVQLIPAAEVMRSMYDRLNG
jgi:putative addiction module component (TIGR02574 family)